MLLRPRQLQKYCKQHYLRDVGNASRVRMTIVEILKPIGIGTYGTIYKGKALVEWVMHEIALKIISKKWDSGFDYLTNYSATYHNIKKLSIPTFEYLYTGNHLDTHFTITPCLSKEDEMLCFSLNNYCDDLMYIKTHNVTLSEQQINEYKGLIQNWFAILSNYHYYMKPVNSNRMISDAIFLTLQLHQKENSTGLLFGDFDNIVEGKWQDCFNLNYLLYKDSFRELLKIVWVANHPICV